MSVFIFLATLLLGYFLGKIAIKQNIDWIWFGGFMVIMLGLSFLRGDAQTGVMLFGAGLFVSDLKNINTLIKRK
jgi:hypothetical protein